MMEVGSSNLVTISCADHSQYVAIALGNLFDCKRGADFDFRVGGKSVRAHRLIVELFLTPESTGSVQRQLPVKQEVSDDDYGSGRDILDLVVEFLYKGEVAVPEQHLEELLGVAKELDFQMLVDAVNVCRPVDIIADDDELNIHTQSDVYCFDNADQVRGLLDPRIQNNPESFDNGESLQLSVNQELTLTPCTVDFGPRNPFCYQSTRTGEDKNRSQGLCQNGSGHILESAKSKSEEFQLQATNLKLEPDDGSTDSDSHSRLDGTVSLGLGLPDCDSNEDNDATQSDTGIKKFARRRRANRLHKCPHCDFESPKFSCYKSHLLTIHRITVKGKPSVELKCPHCELEIPDANSFRRHCLSVHQLTIRGEPATIHKCLKCDYSSVFPESLKLHQGTKHTEVRKYACPQCSYEGKLKTHLTRHLNLIHGVGESRFTCQMCGQRCPTSNALERHTRSHTNERPFQCTHCSHAAKLLYELKVHMSVVHGEGESRFSCPICKKRVESRRSLERHTRTHANERPSRRPRASFDSSNDRT